MEPRLVLVTAAPGSGKSTLTRELSDELRLPFLARDQIRGGLAFSDGAWGETMTTVPPGAQAVDVFLDPIEALLANGVSCIAEYVLRRHRPGDLDRWP